MNPVVEKGGIRDSVLKCGYIQPCETALKKSFELAHVSYLYDIKGTVIQIEKALINDCLRISKVS